MLVLEINTMTIVEFIAMTRLSRDTIQLYKGTLSVSSPVSCSRTVDPDGCVSLADLLLILYFIANFKFIANLTYNGKYHSQIRFLITIKFNFNYCY